MHPFPPATVPAWPSPRGRARKMSPPNSGLVQRQPAYVSAEDLALLWLLKMPWMMRPLNPVPLTLMFTRGDYNVCEDEKICHQRGTGAARIQTSQVWWLIPLLSVPRRLRQEFKASLAYIVSARLAWTTHETLPPKQ